ncbi:NADH-quinone oxidoreductase subunit J family protein [Desertivirga brevis]|uniref:NADH-quinone oxidoreductase subunit J family protein n=1 Tax=Desertivirga brevis TaxID=2810310 RepID=UPI001A9691DB|nr:NADH-quinone oxidoreductase subunit J [Pedobacter sp. SYSU D00873]
MNLEQIVFYVFAAVVLFSALLVVASRNLVRSIFLFFITLFSMAGIFVFALADFVALTQLVIYVGGVLVLMIFAFLLSNKSILDDPEQFKTKLFGIHNLPAILAAFLFFGILLWCISLAQVDILDWIQGSANNTLQVSDNTIHYIGITLMTKYLLPFEVVSIFLLMALIGAAHLARKERKI